MTRPSKGSLPLPGLRWRGLNLQFFALIFLPLTGILLLITFGSLKLHQDAMRTLVGERDERAARTAASAMHEQLNHRAAAVQGLALRAVDQADLDEILATSDFLQPDFDFGLAFFSPQGELLNATGDQALWANLPSELPIFLEDTQAQAGPQALRNSSSVKISAARAMPENITISTGLTGDHGGQRRAFVFPDGIPDEVQIFLLPVCQILGYGRSDLGFVS